LFSLVAFLIWENEKKKKRKRNEKKKKRKEKETKRKEKEKKARNSLMRSELILSLSQTSLDLFYYE